MPGDLTDPVRAGGVVATVERAFGRVDVVAHLVGGWVGGTEVAELEHDEVRRMLDQHLWTTLHVLQAALPGMRARGFGRVVGVSSPFAATPGPRGASYAIAKAAEEVLLRTVAREAAMDGVTANILLVRTLDDERSRAARPNARTAGWTTPDELADAIAWLASPAPPPSTVRGSRSTAGADAVRGQPRRRRPSSDLRRASGSRTRVASRSASQAYSSGWL